MRPQHHLSFTLITGAALGACHSAQPAVWPDLSDAMTLLELVEAPGQMGRVAVLEVQTAPTRIAEVPLGTRITWLNYDRPVEALGLTGLRYADLEDPAPAPPPADDRWEGIASADGLRLERFGVQPPDGFPRD